MKRLAVFAIALFVNGCALEKVADRVESKLDEIDSTLENLHTAQCIRECSLVGEVCLDYANGECIDSCEDDWFACDQWESDCFETNKGQCLSLTGNAYTVCIENVFNSCDQSCNQEEGNCKQDCGSIGQECLKRNSDCIADCIQEFEDSLKGLQLN